ncbi:MAG: type II CAAX endopeptidase family protein [Chloroflexi bacterium]|nr:type II CAAX endopeptidase family protein [Chloroflexota bacterium]
MTEFAPPPLARWRFAHLLWIGGLLAAGLMALGAFIALNNPEVASGDVPLTLEFTLGATALQGLAFLLPVALVGWWVGIDWRTAVGWRNTTTYWWGVTLLLGLLCIPVTGLIATYTQELLGYEEIYNPQLDFVVPEGFSWLALIGNTLTIGLLVPVAEELIFRGVLLTWLAAHVPGWAAVLFTSLLFAAMHGEPSIVAGTLFLGLACGWLVQKSGSLWPAIAVHALNNAVKVVIIYLALLLDIPLV